MRGKPMKAKKGLTLNYKLTNLYFMLYHKNIHPDVFTNTSLKWIVSKIYLLINLLKFINLFMGTFYF